MREATSSLLKYVLMACCLVKQGTTLWSVVALVVVMVVVAAVAMTFGSLSPRNGVSLFCGWRVAANMLNKQS
jgi:hypothetical protein